MKRVLIVDDEPAILAAVAPLLDAAGYSVSTATTGYAALDAVERSAPDLVVVDLGLPDLDGREVCRRLRERRTIPIIILSARRDEGEKVAALDAGADDYVTKPFSADEFLARVRAALRRAENTGTTSGEFVRGDLIIDLDRRRLRRGAEEIRLTPKEFELLLFMSQRPDRVLTHRTILKAIWGPHAAEQPEHLRVLMAALRKKIEPVPGQPKYLLTEPWVGYRFTAGDSEPST